MLFRQSRTRSNFPQNQKQDATKSLRNYSSRIILSFFLRQPMFDLPGGVTYRADFIIFWSDGNVTIEDVKGFETSEFKLKKKMVEELYPINIEVVK